ncbi:MAG: hypothetical protein ACE5KA_08575 [Nitrososphaerales archaeon]
MNLEFYKILLEEGAVVKLLMVIGNKRYHNRELLKVMNERGYAHTLLLRAHKLRLVERKNVRSKDKGNRRVYNRLTKKGKGLVNLAIKIGI